MARRHLFIMTGLAGALSALIVQFPLAWLSPDFLKAQGTVWAGQVTPVEGLGPANVSTSLKRLFKGAPPVELSHNGAGMTYVAKGGLRGIKSFDYQGKLSKLPMSDNRLKGLSGEVRLNLENIKLDDTGCRSASGQAWSNLLSANEQRLSWRGPELSGPVSCADGQVIAKLASSGTGDDIKANITLSPDGSYMAEITAKIDHPQAAMVLGFFGFTPDGDGYRLTEQGRWQ